MEEETGGEISHAFQTENFALGHVDCLDVAEGGVMTQHLDVDSSDEVFFLLFGAKVFFFDLGLEGIELGGDDLIFFLLGSRLTDRLDQIIHFFGQMLAR